MKQANNKLFIALICIILALVTFVAFEPVRCNEFVNYDDYEYITENRQVKYGISLDSVIWAFTATDVSRNWQPLTLLSHMLDCQLFGLNPFWHHLTNLLFHIASTLVLFLVLKRMTGAIWQSAFVAAAFALHPLRVESVAWAAERKDVLSGFFWMLTMLAYVRYTERQCIGRYIFVFLALCLGLMAKPMLVTLPFVLLLLDCWPLNRFQWPRQIRVEAGQQPDSVSTVGKSSSILHLVAEKIPLFFVVGVSSVVTFATQKGNATIYSMDYPSVGLRIGNAAVSYVKYVFKMFYPRHLAVLYPHPGQSLALGEVIICFLVLTVLSTLVIYGARRRGYLFLGWLWYLGTLFPVIGFVQIGSQAMADRYTYLPSIGISIVVAWFAGELFSRWRHQWIFFGVLTVSLVGGDDDFDAKTGQVLTK